MENKSGMAERIAKALESFTVSYAMVIIVYVGLSEAGVFSPLTNQRAFQLMCICFVIAVGHFLLGLFNIKSYRANLLLGFLIVVFAVLGMGLFVFRFFDLTVKFMACIGIMSAAVFAGTFLIAYVEDWKRVKEINEMIKRSRE